MMLEFLWIFLLQFDNCVPNGVESPKNLLKNILRNNGESLKQLVNKFPNHVIEMQVDMGVQTSEPPKRSLTNIRHLLKFNMKPSAHITNNKVGMLLRKHPIKLSGARVRRNEQTEDGVTNQTTTTATSEHGTDPDNRPVYMSDLKEAVEALEKKLITRNTPAEDTSKTQAPNVNELTNDGNSMDDGNHPLLKKDLWELLDIAAQRQSTLPNHSKKLPMSAQAPQQNEVKIESIKDKPSGVKSISDIIKLVQQGVKVQFDITRPTDRNLDWIQIKVPNT